MKRLDDGKVSLVEFMRSIKFAQHNSHRRNHGCQTHFAGFNQRVGGGRTASTEDRQLIRSAN